jgi:hypothetical protein
MHQFFILVSRSVQRKGALQIMSDDRLSWADKQKLAAENRRLRERALRENKRMRDKKAAADRVRKGKK